MTHIEFEKYIQTKHTIPIFKFFDIVEIFNDYTANNNENLEQYLVKYNSMVVFGKVFYPHVKLELHYNQSLFNSKMSVYIGVNVFVKKGI